MKTFVLMLLVMTGCVSNPDCLDLLPAKKYEAVFVRKGGLDDFFCYDQEHVLDFTDEQGLRDSFDTTCSVTVDRRCGEVTTLVATCVGSILTCYIDKFLGKCTHDLGEFEGTELECQYDLWLDPL